MKCLLFVICINFAFQATPAFAGVKEVCGGKYLDPKRTVGELADSYKELACDDSNTQDIKELASGIYDVLARVEAETATTQFFKSRKNEVVHNDLKVKMNQLAQHLNQHKRPLPPPRGSSMNLGSFIAKYPNGIRGNNAQQYFEDGLTVLSQTAKGREIVACWNKTKSMFAAGQFSVVAQGGGPAVGALYEKGTPNASYETTQGYNSDARFVRRITVGRDIEPTQFLHTLAHEITHVCDPKEVADKTEYNDTRSALKAVNPKCLNQSFFQENPVIPERFQEVYQQCRNSPETKELFEKVAQALVDASEQSVVSECKAHKAHVEFYAQLAELSPTYVCNQYQRSARYDNQVVSSGDYFTTMEQDFASGDFAGRLIEFYNEGTLQDEHVCEIHDGKIKKDERGFPVPANRLRQILAEAGCPVR